MYFKSIYLTYNQEYRDCKGLEENIKVSVMNCIFIKILHNPILVKRYVDFQILKQRQTT